LSVDVSLQDWINDTGVDVRGQGRAGGPRRMNAKAAAAAEVVKRDAELRALFVVVPPGDEAKPISCPICKESLKSEFLEDDEDWVWKNAIMKDDKVRILLFASSLSCILIPRNVRFIMQLVMLKLLPLPIVWLRVCVLRSQAEVVRVRRRRNLCVQHLPRQRPT
jgi:hypothetical protein